MSGQSAEDQKGKPREWCELMALFRARQPEHGQLLESLQSSVSQFVLFARARGDPPERVFVELKRMMSDAGYRSTSAPQDKLCGLVLDWFLASYYPS